MLHNLPFGAKRLWRPLIFTLGIATDALVARPRSETKAEGSAND